MAYEVPGFSFPLPAGADFTSGAQFRFCDVSSTGKAVNPSAGGDVIGVRQNRPRLNEATTIVGSGISIVETGGAITVGAKVQTDATGRAVVNATGGRAIGRALETSTGAGIQIAVLLTPAVTATP